MKYFRLWLLVFSLNAQAGIKETIDYIYKRLGQGSEVAILVIDMQPDFYRYFENPGEASSVVSNTVKLINTFSVNKRVHFI